MTVFLLASLLLAPQDGAVVKKALEYLHRELPRVVDNKGTPFKASLQSLTALAFLASRNRKYDAHIRRSKAALSGYVKQVSGKDVYQSTWPVAFAGWMFAELASRRQGDHDTANRIISHLQTAQKKDGGWGHSLNQVDYLDSYPRTLIVTTNAALTALGLLSRQGYRVDRRTIDRALKHYDGARIQGKKWPDRFKKPDQLKDHWILGGGMPYDATQNAGGEPGRTSGAWWATWSVDEPDEKAAEFVMKTLAALPEGHASSALHVFTGAVTCRLLGEKEWKAFKKLYGKKIRAAQQKDGSFRCICSGDRFACDEPVFDNEHAVRNSRIYITALYSLILQLDRLDVLKKNGKEKPGPAEGTPTPSVDD